ncbi:serine/threonine-protein kinase [Embleya sp. NBC_00896]|uniref:serine/threonine-protein kinase n=1 Tax=Embleya sp. NBC_00896 TaxID=2975961 RepID=UPI00386CCF93|nr:serine/threonine protein kinase [Embleya sp. NBC_00896]
MQTQQLGDRYTWVGLLGRGGMGEVWEAWDAELQRAVAVKLLTAVPGDPGAGSWLRDEARAVARLSDPNIAAVHDVCRAPDGRDYLVMELVRGSSVQQLIRGHGPLPWPTVADLGAQTARALAAAHRASVVHHDIKPSNLLVTDDQVVKVVDFGIAATADADTAPDAGGASRLGTAAYTAPERALGNPTGPAADLYALGCVLYEALTGQPPFVGDDPAEVLYRHVHEEPAPVAQARPDAPAELGALVHRLLAKNPQDRPRSAAETAHALAAWAGPGPAAVTVPDEGATQLLPPVPASAPADAALPDDGATALLPSLLSDDEPPHSARRGDPATGVACCWSGPWSARRSRWCW